MGYNGVDIIFKTYLVSFTFRLTIFCFKSLSEVHGIEIMSTAACNAFVSTMPVFAQAIVFACTESTVFSVSTVYVVGLYNLIYLAVKRSAKTAS